MDREKEGKEEPQIKLKSDLAIRKEIFVPL